MSIDKQAWASNDGHLYIIFIKELAFVKMIDHSKRSCRNLGDELVAVPGKKCSEKKTSEKLNNLQLYTCW